MAKLSDKRRQAIYAAVHDRFMDLRVTYASALRGSALVKPDIDAMIFRATEEAGQAAIEAAETGKHTRTWREESTNG